MQKIGFLLSGLLFCMVGYGAEKEAFNGLNPDSYALYKDNSTKKEIMGRLAQEFAHEAAEQFAQFSAVVTKYFNSIDSSQVSAGQAHQVFEQYAQKQVDRLKQEVRAMQTQVVALYYQELQKEGYAISWDVTDMYVSQFVKYSESILQQGYQAILDLMSTLYTDRMSSLISMDLQKITSEIEKEAYAQAQQYLKDHYIKPQTMGEELQEAAGGLLKQFLGKVEKEVKSELQKQAKKMYASVQEKYPFLPEDIKSYSKEGENQNIFENLELNPASDDSEKTNDELQKDTAGALRTSVSAA